jgi:hypothetical protein
LWGTNGCPTPQHRKTGFQYINYLRARLLCSFVLPHSLSLSVSLFLPSSCCCFWIASLCVPQQQQPRAYGDTAIAPLFLRDGAASEGSDTHGTQLLVCVYGQRMAAWPCLRLLCNVLYTRTHERETNIGHEFHPVTLVCRRPARRISGSGEIGTHAVGGSREQEREREREREWRSIPRSRPLPAHPTVETVRSRVDQIHKPTGDRWRACAPAKHLEVQHPYIPTGPGDGGVMLAMRDGRRRARQSARCKRPSLSLSLSISLSSIMSQACPPWRLRHRGLRRGARRRGDAARDGKGWGIHMPSWRGAHDVGGGVG